MNRHDYRFRTKPLRRKTFLLTWLAIYPLINFIFLVFGAFLEMLPLYLRTLVLTGLLVFLMTYVVMSKLNDYFYRWLHT